MMVIFIKFYTKTIYMFIRTITHTHIHTHTHAQLETLTQTQIYRVSFKISEKK